MDEGYQKAKNIVNHMQVVNDHAERVVQLGSQFIHTVKLVLFCT